MNFRGLPFCFAIICLLPHSHTQLQSSLEKNHPCGSVWVMICQSRLSTFAKWNYQKDGHQTGEITWWLASRVHFSPKAFVQRCSVGRPGGCRLLGPLVGIWSSQEHGLQKRHFWALDQILAGLRFAPPPTPSGFHWAFFL